MGAVALALGLLWAASDLSSPPPDELPSGSDAASVGEDDTKAVGKQAPLDYTLKDMNGADVRLASFKGKVILLNFWATWCQPCKDEIPDLDHVYKQQYKDDIVVLGFSIDDTAGGAEEVRGEVPDELSGPGGRRPREHPGGVRTDVGRSGHRHHRPRRQRSRRSSRGFEASSSSIARSSGCSVGSGSMIASC